MAAIFEEGKFFWKLQRVHSLDTLWVENFDEIALSRTVKEIEANLCFAIFGKNSKIQNGRHFWGGENCLKLQRVHSLDTLWGENFDEIALSLTVKEIEGNSCFAIFGKNSKIQNGRHFWGGENFLKIASEMPVPHSLGKYFQHHEIQKYCTSTNFRILSEHCQLYKGPNNV